MIRQARAGDPLAFEELIRPHLDSVRRFVFSFSSNWQDADDITQEALLKAFRSFATFDGRASLSTWLYTVARTAAIDWHRSRIGRRSDDDLLPEEALPGAQRGQEEAVAGKQEAERLWVAIQSLDDRSRVPLVLFEIEGLSYDEIATIEQVPVGTIRSRLSRARQQLRETLDAGSEAPASAARATADADYPQRRLHG